LHGDLPGSFLSAEFLCVELFFVPQALFERLGDAFLNLSLMLVTSRSDCLFVSPEPLRARSFRRSPDRLRPGSRAGSFRRSLDRLPLRVSRDRLPDVCLRGGSRSSSCAGAFSFSLSVAFEESVSFACSCSPSLAPGGRAEEDEDGTGTAASTGSVARSGGSASSRADGPATEVCGVASGTSTGSVARSGGSASSRAGGPATEVCGVASGIVPTARCAFESCSAAHNFRT